MKNTGLRRTVRKGSIPLWVGLSTLAVGVGGFAPALAGDPPGFPTHFSGLLNDYTPATATVKGSPYEMHGKWTLFLHDERNTATFSAEMTMETADFANPDPGHDPTKLNPHTHHISVTDGVVHRDPNDPVNWQTACPTLTPPVTRGFVVTGTAYVTGNGGNAPFGNPSPATICILGGMSNPDVTGTQAFIAFSNLTLKFGAPANTHFGLQAIHGVVARCEGPWNREATDCRVAVVE
jgi:hypothetical protein